METPAVKLALTLKETPGARPDVWKPHKNEREEKLLGIIVSVIKNQSGEIHVLVYAFFSVMLHLITL